MAEEWMSPEEIETLEEQARQGCINATERVPTPSDWGFFAYGDAPPAIGGGAGAFLWFSDRSAMLDYVRRFMIFMLPGPMNADWAAVSDAVHAIVDAVERSEIQLETGMIRLNKALKSFSQLEWWGTFDLLLSSPDIYPRRVRARFRDSENEDSDEAASPILSLERERFLEFIQTYGV